MVVQTVDPEQASVVEELWSSLADYLDRMMARADVAINDSAEHQRVRDEVCSSAHKEPSWQATFKSVWRMSSAQEKLTSLLKEILPDDKACCAAGEGAKALERPLQGPGGTAAGQE
jgi:hypothetical protein